MRLTFLLFSASALFSSVPSFAQSDSDHHEAGNDQIIVTGAIRREGVDVLGGISVVTQEELKTELRNTIGETLARQPGVSATSFGPNASRPILRGFQGERVRVLSDGIGSFDVSNTSVDHAVAINPLTADKIEVLRGPAALLFGSSAIGGVVNVIDSRIPRSRVDGSFHFDGLASYASAAREKAASGRADLAITDNLVAHVDASYLKSSDLRVGGFLLSPQLRQAAATSGDPDIASNADLRGRLANSAAKTSEFTGGLAYLGDSLTIGASVARLDSLYGIPVRFPVAIGEEAEAVRLDAGQTRYDLRGEYDFDGSLVDTIKLRAGYADYGHNELEEDGAVGSRFFSKGGEARLELVQADRGGWVGAVGVQYFGRSLRIEGDEKFLPASKSRQVGLFTVQSLKRGSLRFEVGGRAEFSRLSAQADAQLGTPALKRKFTTHSSSLGGNWEFTDGWRIGASASLSARAPAAEELFPNGPHVGTQAFEIGDPTLKKEKSRGLELNVRGRGDGYSISAGIFKSWFSNFIYDQPTGALEDGLPIFEYRQNKAHYSGAELEVEKRLAEIGGMEVQLNAVADYTRATVIAPGTRFPALRIPPLRLVAGLGGKSSKFDFGGEVEWADGQKRVPQTETATPGFTLVNFNATYRPWGQSRDIGITLSANNVFNVVARRHSSLLKDYAPLAGRDFRISLRMGI
jgi:iron complex outermembrane recepter protein